MKKLELLVPAGGKAQFIAAVENGADAVYLGGTAFNARINAGNFDNETLREAVAFAHKRGVQVHVTMNTLVDDDELKPALNAAANLYEMGVDALIIQDLGLGKIIAENMPDFPLHVSTQGTVYDGEGAAIMARLGYSRIVLARELSLEEIANITATAGVETEVFVHGAQCICYSGQCQLSRHNGGRSGNRGQCAQPCRLPYKTLDENRRLVNCAKYPLSPKDMCLIDHLKELQKAGVNSLKIEGRMKSAEYVAVVTSIYRKYLDMLEAKGDYTVDSRDRLALEQIFNRGGFTDGYLMGETDDYLMAGNIPKHQGIKIGKVIKTVQGGQLIDVKLYDKLQIGDGVEIQGKNITGNVVTYYKELKDGLTRIGDIKGQVSHGDPLYRITSKAQLEEAERTYKNVDFHSGKFTRKSPVSMELRCADGCVLLKVTSGLNGLEAEGQAGPFEPSEEPMNSERLENSLRKTGNTPFRVDDVKFDGDFSYKIPVAAVNGLRRETLDELECAMAQGREKPKALFFDDYVPEERPEALEFYFFSWEDFCNFPYPELLVQHNGDDADTDFPDLEPSVVLPLVECIAHSEELGIGPGAESGTEMGAGFGAEPGTEVSDGFGEIGNIRIIPYITNVARGEESDWIYAHEEQVIKLCRESGVYIGNMSWLLFFRSNNIMVYGDYGLNAYNRQSALLLEQLGFKWTVDSLESCGEHSGSYPLMILQHEPAGSILIDRKKTELDLIKSDFRTPTILAEKSHHILEDTETLKREGNRRILRYYVNL